MELVCFVLFSNAHRTDIRSHRSICTHCYLREKKRKIKWKWNKYTNHTHWLAKHTFFTFSWMECCARWFGKMWTLEVAQKLLSSIQLPKHNKTKQNKKKVANKQISQTKKKVHRHLQQSDTQPLCHLYWSGNFSTPHWYQLSSHYIVCGRVSISETNTNWML